VDKLAYVRGMTERSANDTRERLVRAAEQLFRTQGYAATGLKQLTAEAAAPWGSLYHFFPEGKEQLGAAAIDFAAAFYAAGWRAAFASTPDPAIAIERVFLNEVKVLTASDYRDGCPIASVTLDSSSASEALRAACAGAFETWLAAMVEGFAAAGAPEDVARDLAVFVLAALEGAIVLSRAAKDPAPLLRSARFVRQAVAREAANWTSGSLRPSRPADAGSSG
jgi:TetR/AcrR family transcriptional repressor of lmrAB and yxaGH operons